MKPTLLAAKGLRCAAGIAVATAVVLPGKTAGGTAMVPLSLVQLTRLSPWVVQGRITSTRSYWNRRQNRILTRNTIAVHRFLKGRGTTRRSLAFHTMGGRIGRINMRVLGAPCFKTGEHVIVFLTQRGSRLYVTGMAQGKFTIRQDPNTKARVVTRNLAGVQWMTARPKWPGRANLDRLLRTIKAAQKRK